MRRVPPLREVLNHAQGHARTPSPAQLHDLNSESLSRNKHTASLSKLFYLRVNFISFSHEAMQDDHGLIKNVFPFLKLIHT